MGGRVTGVDDDISRGFALYAPAGPDIHMYESGAFAFVVGPHNVLSIINITDAANPVRAATVRGGAAFDSPRGPFDVEVQGTSAMTYALITGRDRGHAGIINVTEPNAPSQIPATWQSLYHPNLLEQATDTEVFAKSYGAYALTGKFYTDSLR